MQERYDTPHDFHYPLHTPTTLSLLYVYTRLSSLHRYWSVFSCCSLFCSSCFSLPRQTDNITL